MRRYFCWLCFGVSIVLNILPPYNFEYNLMCSIAVLLTGTVLVLSEANHATIF
jgi:hypothetical protein